MVAFEADEFDPEERTGWSVTVIGHARAVHDPAEIAELAALPLTAWTPGSRDHYIVVDAEQVSGRRIVRNVRPSVAHLCASSSILSGGHSPRLGQLHGDRLRSVKPHRGYDYHRARRPAQA